jgi:hypothetical protein
MIRLVRRAALGLSLVAAATAGSAALLAAGAAATAPSVPAQVTASSWTAVPVPQPSAATGSYGDGVSCVTSSFCVQVGIQVVGSDNQALITQWSGSSWAIAPSPSTAGSTDTFLNAVSCTSTSFCVAAGFQRQPSAPEPFFEHWNGTAWTVVPAVIPTGSTGASITGVSCTGATFCMAVGDQAVSSGSAPLVEQWNGTAWSVVTTPNLATPGDTALSGVSCRSNAFCMAVGYQNGDTQTLAEMWNGTAWTVVASPNDPAGTTSEFHSVSCAGTRFCAAVGESRGGSITVPSDNLVALWGGSAFTMSPAPNPSAGFGGALSGVSCFSATSCTAVGQTFLNSGSRSDTQGQTWNGQSWTIVSTPNGPVSTTLNYLGAVDCLTDWACVTVGDAFDGTNHNPLAAWAPIARSGYRFVASDGGIFAYGAGAPFLGSLGGTVLNQPIVGMAVMPAGDGYYLVAADGGVFSYGSAIFHGSTGSMHLNKPIVGMALTADGEGYWLVASDGGIFAFGDAQFYGSTGSIALNKPVVGMASTPNGLGYFLVASDGGMFNYGNAHFAGSTGSIVLNKPVVGLAVTTSGGYFLVATDGGIFAYGGAVFAGSTGSIHLNKPIVGMTTVANGYYLSGSDGGIFAYPTSGGPTFLGSTGSIVLNKPIVGVAS